MYYENFAKLCEESNIKPNKVSKETGISTATLTSWKQGKYTPKQDKLQKIADFFGVPLRWLMGDMEEEINKYGDALIKIEREVELVQSTDDLQKQNEQKLARLLSYFNAINNKNELLSFAEYLYSKEKKDNEQ